MYLHSYLCFYNCDYLYCGRILSWFPRILFYKNMNIMTDNGSLFPQFSTQKSKNEWFVVLLFYTIMLTTKSSFPLLHHGFAEKKMEDSDFSAFWHSKWTVQLINAICLWNLFYSLILELFKSFCMPMYDSVLLTFSSK